MATGSAHATRDRHCLGVIGSSRQNIPFMMLTPIIGAPLIAIWFGGVMKNAWILNGLMPAVLLGGCGSHDVGTSSASSDAVGGETPGEVASSLQRMQDKLSPAKAADLSHAVDTLTRVTPDKHDSRTVGEMSPQFVSMVQGRNADQIIQLAVLYRVSAPPDPR